MAGKTGDTGEGSKEVGSQRPECDREGEPRNRRPGSGRTAGRGAHSAKSRLVHQRGPAGKAQSLFYTTFTSRFNTMKQLMKMPRWESDVSLLEGDGWRQQQRPRFK